MGGPLLPVGEVDDVAVLRAVAASGGQALADRLAAISVADRRGADAAAAGPVAEAAEVGPPTAEPGTAAMASAPATHPATHLTPPSPPAAGAAWDFDVVVLGGGLSLLCAQLFAQAGRRVLVVEKQRQIAAQRAWNASWEELRQLVDCGLVAAEALARLVVARYRDGVCRWHRAGETRVAGVLDCAVDAEALLVASQGALRAHGGELWLGYQVGPLAFSPHGVAGVAQAPGGGPPRPFTAGVVLDGRGFQSPYANHDLVCPTVGGIVAGLEEGDTPDTFNPQVGEILATTEGIENGRQHIWEAFPGRPGEAAVYLFYYARRGEVDGRALLPLYRRFCARLGGYKRGPATLVRPTFGIIPGWSRLGPGSRSPHPRVVLVGDAASQHSPLTFCGFGAFLRALSPLRQQVLARLQGDTAPSPWPPRREAALHRGTGALAYLMAVLPQQSAVPPAQLNTLLAAAFAQLAKMGPDAYRALLQDSMSPRALCAFMWGTSRSRPEVYRLMAQTLGAGRLARWTAAMAWAVGR